MTETTPPPSFREEALEVARDSTDLMMLLQELYYLDGDGYVTHAEQRDHTPAPQISVNAEDTTDRETVEHLLELADTAGWGHIYTSTERDRLTFRQAVSDSERRDELLRCDYCGRIISEKDGAELVFSSDKSQWGCSEEHLRAAQQVVARGLRAALQGGRDE